MRSAFDKFISWTGLLMAVVLLVAGGLLWWAHSFIGDQVNEQLTMQGITMPEGDALASLPKADAEALKPYVSEELRPGPQAQSDAELLEAARALAQTIYHPVGTCKMGPDSMAVVDERLRVHGVAGLRVIDASVFPSITSGNTNAPTVMVAEKGAQMVLEDGGA